MATLPGFSAEREKAARRSPVPSALNRHRILGARCAVGLLLTAGLIPCLRAAEVVRMPGLPTDATERAWYTAFMTRFTARVVPSFRVDPELEAKVASLWDSMVMRLTGGKGAYPTPLDPYPLLSFVDERFLVMKIKDSHGKDSYVVRADNGQMPTLSSTLVAYLDDVIYPSLRSIAEEEKQKLVEQPGYEPSLQQLAAQNPFLHGLPIRVPEMGPFKNRIVAFTGPLGRLSAAETAEYDARKWEAAGGRKVLGVVRSAQWGMAVEIADLVEEGRTVCRYRFVREVSAVKDEFVGEGRRGVLLRQPRLGPLLEISGCLGDCEQAARWTRIFPEPEKGRAPSPLPRKPLMPEIGDASLALPIGPAPLVAGSGSPF